MRLNNNPLKLAVVALFAGGMAVAVHAASPAPRHMAVENDAMYLEHLRAEKRSLEGVKDMLDKEDMADRSNNRHDAIEHISKAIDKLQSEIATYDKDVKNGK